MERKKANLNKLPKLLIVGSWLRRRTNRLLVHLGSQLHETLLLILEELCRLLEDEGA